MTTFRGVRVTTLMLSLLLIATTAVYANHFQNSFHFDDFHTVTDNVYIRSLANVPRFFSDPASFSSLPTHQVYRPLVTTSLAVDHWLAQGLHPWAFHATTFFWYGILLLVLFFLFRRLTGGRDGVSLFATGLYGLHPVSAETINYVIQRGELYATLGVAAALSLFILKPRLRRYGLYLVPFVLAILSKPPALVFPLILLMYVRLFEERTWAAAWRRSAPAWLTAVAGGVLLSRMIAPTFAAGGGDRAAYWISQTWVTCGYFAAFFWPVHLSADTDQALLSGFPPEAWIGTVFVLALIALCVWMARTPGWRPAAFGVIWFLLALVPTALMPLAEVANDHRMFFPFVGLTLTVSWTAAKVIEAVGASGRRAAVVAACLILAASGYATHRRNEVWRSEETLWRDVKQKSPKNGRGWMNLGLALMTRAEYAQALDCFERAHPLIPNYALLEINLGIVKGALGRPPEAEAHFQRARLLAPNSTAPHHYYGRWLLERGRYAEAVERLEDAVRLGPTDQAARGLLMKAHFDQQNWSALRSLTKVAVELDAGDAVARRYQELISALDQEIRNAEEAAGRESTPEALLQLSLLYYRAGRFADCVRAAGDAIRMRPGYVAAYINLTAGYNAMQRWEEAIAVGREAVRLDPANQLARNNLAWAMAGNERANR